MSNMPINESNSSNFKPVAIGVALTGGAILVGAVFVTLAAFQVLPHGVNVIIHLGQLGKGIGYGAFALGGVVIGGVAVASVVRHLQEKKVEDVENEKKEITKQFFKAIENGNTEEVKRLMVTDPTLRASKNAFDETPLNYVTRLNMRPTSNAIEAQYLLITEYLETV